MSSNIIFTRRGQPLADLVQYRGCGLDNLYLANGYRIRKRNGETYMSVKDVEGLHFKIALCLATRLVPLTAKEFRFLRKFVNLTQDELARQFDVTRGTINRYENDQTVIPKPTRILLQLMALQHVLELPAKIANVDAGAVKGLINEATDYLLQVREDLSPNETCMDMIEGPPAFVIDAMGDWKSSASSGSDH